MLKKLTDMTREELIEALRVNLLDGTHVDKQTPADKIRYDIDLGEIIAELIDVELFKEQLTVMSHGALVISIDNEKFSDFMKRIEKLDKTATFSVDRVYYNCEDFLGNLSYDHMINFLLRIKEAIVEDREVAYTEEEKEAKASA